MDIINTLLLFDENKPSPSSFDVIIYTAGILIASNLIFIVLCFIFKIDSNKTLEDEKDIEFAEWKKKNISPWSIAASEILNSTIYSPIAEEIAFRLILMKFVCSKGLKMNNITANILQSIIFGLMHLSNSVYTTQTKKYTYLQTLSATISGLVSGWVYVKTNSLLPSLFAHMINNGAAGTTELFSYISYLKKHPN